MSAHQAGDSRWQLLQHFLVRGTGFPIELLSRLSFDRTHTAIERLLDCEDRVAQLGGKLVEALRVAGDPGGAAVRRGLARRVRRGRPATISPADRAVLPAGVVVDEWNAELSRLTELDRIASATFADELAARRSDLRELTADQRLQEAVWLCSPSMLEHGLLDYQAGRGDPSVRRRIERQLVTYLQRFCAKNDTASFFGPINYGSLGGAGSALRPGEVGCREARMTHWAVVALAGAIARDPAVRPYLRPRRTGLRRAGAATSATGHGSPRLDLLDAVDGESTAAYLADRLGRPLEDVLDALDELASRRLISLEPHIAVGDPNPLRALREWVSSTGSAEPAGLLATLDGLVAAQDEFATAPLPGKRRLLGEMERAFTGLTGLPPRRGGGEFYADRLIVTEEAAGAGGPLALEPAAGEGIRRRLEPVLDLLAGHACEQQARFRAHAAARLAELDPDNAGVPLLRFVTELRDEPAPATRPTELQRAMLDQLRGREDEREVRLDPAALPVADPAALDREVLLSSLDLMLVAGDLDAVRSGSARIVVGECHDTVLVWGWPLRFHPDAGRIERAAAGAVRAAAGGARLANVLPSRRVKIVPFEYPGITVQLIAPSGRTDTTTVAAADVTVALADGVPALRAPGVGTFHLYNGELLTPSHRALGLPRVVPPVVETGRHTPRLCVGDVVLQRERWRLTGADVLGGGHTGGHTGDTVAPLVDYQRAARRLGLPRHVFVRATGDRKPILIDRDNWFLVQALHRLLEGGREVVATEMLPGPGQLWLHGATGAFCAELRLVAYRTRGRA